MSLLWTQAARHQAMPWHEDRHSTFQHPTVHSVRNAGFAGYTNDREQLEELRESSGEDHDKFDENLYEDATPDMTPEEEAHHEEHGEPPESYYERHDQAYEQAKHQKAQEDEPDDDDPGLMRFVGDHGDNPKLWHKYGTLGHVDLTKPVHATQSHVSQTHIDRYRDNPHDSSDHVYSFGPSAARDYPGEEAPMFVTHGGALHVTEGHHRTAAALQSGKKSIRGWHYDLDKDPAKTKVQREVEGDETWKDPDEWDDDDHEKYSED